MAGAAGHGAPHPLGRFGRPEEVAGTIVFLCSRQAGFITGAAVDVAGGVQRYV